MIAAKFVLKMNGNCASRTLVAVLLGMTIIKSKLTTLRTVFPPISNADAARFSQDPEVEKLLRQSDFYMIGARAQARFLNPAFNAESEVISFDFVIGDGNPTPVQVAIRDLPAVAPLNGASVVVEFDGAGSGLRIWDAPPNDKDAEVLEWFTPEKLLWDRARHRSGIAGLDNVRDLATYDLLYVGIATKGDSFDRLLARGHKARQEILSNEPQRYPGARVSDEIFLFLFVADPLVIQTFELDHDFSDEDLAGTLDQKRIVADAEKAFVSTLKPNYNLQVFANYPRGRDGLYGSDYGRYGYVIGEQMAFNTAHGAIRGGVDAIGMISNDADAIFVEGDEVTLFRSGVDFPNESGALVTSTPAP